MPQQRKEEADALTDLAVDNFIEIRDKTASRAFRAKKARSPARGSSPRRPSAALHDGHVHAHSVRGSRATGVTPELNRLRWPIIATILIVLVLTLLFRSTSA